MLASLIDIALLVTSLIIIRRQSKRKLTIPKNDENYLQDHSLTILVPAYNEEEKIVSCIDNIMKNRYLKHKITPLSPLHT